uniref:Uncharacterized protein n=1 Tax=Mus spicilegus TaxID=10103 RepID=A0A8C6GVM1_MUSSI
MLSIQPITLRTRDKELAAICTGTTQAWSRVSKFKIFICKWTPVNTGDSSAIALIFQKPPLPVEGASFVSYRNAIFSLWFTWSISLPKVLCRLRHHVCKELDFHATNFLSPAPHLAANADIEEDHWIDWT